MMITGGSGGVTFCVAQTFDFPMFFELSLFDTCAAELSTSQSLSTCSPTMAKLCHRRLGKRRRQAIALHKSYISECRIYLLPSFLHLDSLLDEPGHPLHCSLDYTPFMTSEILDTWHMKTRINMYLGPSIFAVYKLIKKLDESEAKKSIISNYHHL